MTKNNVNEIIFSPGEIATLSTQAITDAKQRPPGLRLPYPILKEKFVMARKGKFIGLLADTSQGKTTMMTDIARQFLPQIEPDEIGVYVTWEDSVEDFGMNDIANISRIPVASLYAGDVTEKQFGEMMRAASQRASSPLWVIGHSEAQQTSRPGLTMTDIQAAIENLITVQGKKVRYIMYDYLQQVNLQDIKESDTRLKYADVVRRMKNLALGYGMTTFCASQVKREIQTRKWRQPQMHDAMETSNFEHTCDGMLSLWMPSKSDGWALLDIVQDKKNVDDKAIFVTPELVLVRVLKQKKAEAPLDVALDIVPEYATFVGYGKAREYRENNA